MRINDLVPERVAYQQLAEEAVELAHAALKLSRIVDPEQNQTVGNISEDQVVSNLLEEMGDVMCCLEVALGYPRLDQIVMVDELILKCRDEKYKRWLERLENAKKDEAE